MQSYTRNKKEKKSNKEPNLKPKEIRERRANKLKLSTRENIIMIRAEINK